LTESPVDPRVDELRRQLRALGYLDAGVNRFVLGPVRESRRPAAIALLASLRIGLIAAVLLGPAAAIGLVGRLPGLVTGPRDASVVALYMGVLFGAAVSIAAFAASLAVASLAGERIARSAVTLSRAAGAIVAVACLAYLTLWWRTANAGFGWAAPVWTGFALAVAVAISLLLGQGVTVAAFAVIVAGRSQRGGPAPTERRGGAPAASSSSSSSWKTQVAAGALAFAGAAALLVVTAPRGSRPETGPPLTVVSSGLRVRLIAIDGFDPAVFEELSRSGRVPALAAALSSTRARLGAPDDGIRDPARAWTTIATGQNPEAHGVRGLETRRVAGLQGAVASTSPSGVTGAIRSATDLLRLTRPAIASGAERREKTLWEVASDAGLRTAVVNWWVTWPAQADGGQDKGVVLSDRATLRLERGGALDAEIAPAALYERLRGRWPVIRQEAADRARAAWPSPLSSDAEAPVLQRSAELDAIQLVLAKEVSTPAPDLLAVYLPGLDIAQHALLRTPDRAMAASMVASRLRALGEYYVFLDRLLAQTLPPASGELVAIVTAPGRVAESADGLLGIRGRVAAPDTAVTGRVTDVMPTLLQALGVPVSRELAGSPLVGLFTPAFVRRYPVREVASYGRPSTQGAERKGKPLDREMIDRLRSLGYVR
jgi:hypothetical protein